jgi:hypothetical protein
MFGYPTSRLTHSRTSTTSAPRNVNRGSIAGENRENVSMIVSTLAPRCKWVVSFHSAL